LGWLVVIRTGKNWLTASERQELWLSGSKARQRRPVYACTYPARRQRPRRHVTPVDNHRTVGAGPAPTCALPTTRSVCGLPSVPLGKNFTPDRASRTAPPGRTPTQTMQQKPAYRADPRVVRLAKDLRARIPWLAHVPHQRIMPPLHRYAVAGWAARDVHTHLDRLVAARGWSVPGRPAATERDYTGRVRTSPATRLRSPWGYLAFLLRHLDPGDLPLEHAHKEYERAIQDYQRHLLHGAPCPHGQPGGDIPSPTKAVVACVECRHSRFPAPAHTDLPIPAPGGKCSSLWTVSEPYLSVGFDNALRLRLPVAPLATGSPAKDSH
jgi:hypothetical protein